MKRIGCIVLTNILLMLPAYSAAYEVSGFGDGQQDCFAKAMIGMDSVINSRLGVPPEHALDLTVKSHRTSTSDAIYDSKTLNVILAAYLWEDTPHDYAVRVFYNCATQKAYPKQASLE